MIENFMDWCGLIVTVGDVEASPVPLSSATIRAHIIDSVAEVTIEHNYVNKGDQAIETIYKFPLDASKIVFSMSWNKLKFTVGTSGAAVCSFSAQVGDRLFEGVVKDTEETQDEYDEAIQSGHAAFFLREALPDVFKVQTYPISELFKSKSQRINKHCIFVQAKTGRLLPGSAAKICLTYVTELKVECGEVRFLLPRAMAPRFMPRIDTRGPASDLASIPQTSTA